MNKIVEKMKEARKEYNKIREQWKNAIRNIILEEYFQNKELKNISLTVTEQADLYKRLKDLNENNEKLYKLFKECNITCFYNKEGIFYIERPRVDFNMDCLIGREE